jgi:hypothetical protein
MGAGAREHEFSDLPTVLLKLSETPGDYVTGALLLAHLHMASTPFP